MVTLVKSAETVAAGFVRGNSIRAGRYVDHLLTHVGMLPTVSLVKGPRVSLVKSPALEYVPIVTAPLMSRVLFDLVERTRGDYI